MNSSSNASRGAVGPQPHIAPDAQPSAEQKLLRDAWGALNFILAFYEPGQCYLDTNAWTQAEASGRRTHKAIREYLDALPAKGTGADQ